MAYQPINITAATLSLVAGTHGDATITANRAAGITFTLPRATGSGTYFRIVVGTTITSNNLIVQVTSTDIFTGTATIAQDSADTAVVFETASDSDTATLNGSTKGGIKGDILEFEDVSSGLWSVRILASGTGTEASPFSAAVS